MGFRIIHSCIQGHVQGLVLWVMPFKDFLDLPNFNGYSSYPIMQALETELLQSLFEKLLEDPYNALVFSFSLRFFD